MKRILALALLLAIAGTALYLAQKRQHEDAVSPNAVLDVTADWQRDLSRAPMQMTRLPDSEEVRIGDELAQNYLATGQAHDAHAQMVEAYVVGVGMKVAAHTKRKLDYRFHLIADRDFINAFALPGGHVFIGQGLLNQMTTEDELAFVLGHEIEHIDHYHAVERVQIEAQLHNLNLDALAAIAELPMSLWQAGYSKEQEFEADREGLRLAAMAGYSPQGAIDMFNRFAELDQEYVIHAETPPEELSQVAVEGLEGYFRTHPLPSERLAQATAVIAQDGLDARKAETPLNEEYKTASMKARPLN
jgi:beta-barrel assembly-enhancing protease